MPLSSLPALSRIDIATTDPAVLPVAVRLPDTVQPRAGGVTMDAVTMTNVATETVAFPLVETRDPADVAGLPPQVDSGVATHAYRLSGEDLDRFDALRQSVLRRHAQGEKVSLGFGIATKEFCRAGLLPPGPLPASTYLLTSETGRYVVLTGGVDLRAEPQVMRELLELAPC